ncbi:hypothetical protein SKAU_G00388440 [Synaphobranchus kaupii]|uniref:Uncharacterized protein n=1 Tax=Synaphobranchus kaupii TaxID=118154 RepID=A0A9Q1EB45_SYNKA|nr:hypothetical protein SKAU_G00388440 [Synaphobranchus kaupii]
MRTDVQAHSRTVHVSTPHFLLGKGRLPLGGRALANETAARLPPKNLKPQQRRLVKTRTVAERPDSCDGATPRWSLRGLPIRVLTKPAANATAFWVQA